MDDIWAQGALYTGGVGGIHTRVYVLQSDTKYMVPASALGEEYTFSSRPAAIDAQRAVPATAEKRMKVASPDTTGTRHSGA
jgi:hypothetical protein